MLVFIRHGKGGQQRYVMLSMQLLEILTRLLALAQTTGMVVSSSPFYSKPAHMARSPFTATAGTWTRTTRIRAVHQTPEKIGLGGLLQTPVWRPNTGIEL